MVVCFENSVGRYQTITYFVSVILSFFVVIPVGITLRNFQGSCILFAQVVWDGRTIWPYSEPCCDFILYMNLGCTLIYAFLMGIYSLCINVPRRFPFARQHAEQLKPIESHEKKFLIHGVNPVFMLINSVIMFMVLSNAIVITVGLGKFCSWALEGIGDSKMSNNNVVTSCAGVQNDLDWSEFRIIRGETRGVKGSSFYTSMGIATVASWLLFLDWFFQWILNFSQSFTMCSCDVAEEKRKPDQALLIASRRSRLATPIHTPGRYTPPIHGAQGGPMRPYAFRPQPGTQYTRPQQMQMQEQPPMQMHQQPQMQMHQQPPMQMHQQPPVQMHQQPPMQMQRQQQPYIQRPAPQQEPLQMQQGYVPPRR